MQYIQIKITHPENAREPLIALLYDLGMKGIYEDSVVNAYFDEDADSRLICARIKELESFLKLDDPIATEACFLPDTDWNEEWKKSFTPIEVGRSLIITPPWLSADGERTEIIVDPAMAFGTGHHETTRRCLELIEQISPETDLSNFLDLGAGTGILSIAASKLGFKKITAIDNDSLAHEAAIKNAQLNRLDNIEVMLGTISDVRGRFAMIAANLISETLIDHANAIAGLLANGGKLILSGMLQGQQDEVISKYTESGLSLSKIFHDDKWVTLVFQKG